MADEKKEDLNRPAGSFLFSWLGNPNSVKWTIYFLSFVCVLLFLGDFIYNRYGHFSVEEWKGFYAFYGFIMFSFIIFGAKTLRFFIRRPENYYGDKAVDSEIHEEVESKKNE